jgi:dienelactone hydrolase
MHRFISALILFCSLSFPAAAEIITKEIAYNDGDVQLTGFAAYDDSIKGFKPGVLIVHEWWGHNDYVRERAKQLAGLGYIAFALDMYGTGVKGETPDAATALSKPFYDDRQLMVERATAGLNVLRSIPDIDPFRVAAIGYCFGGTVVLEMARAGAPLSGAVSFHGGLSTPLPAKAGEISTQILALNGGSDPFVPQAEKDAFTKEMTEAKARFQSIDYAGATHAFTNPAATDIGKKFNIPVAYDEKADKESWEEMKKFLNRVLVSEK